MLLSTQLIKIFKNGMKIQVIQQLNFDVYIFEENKLKVEQKNIFQQLIFLFQSFMNLRQKPGDLSCLHIDYDINSLKLSYDTSDNKEIIQIISIQVIQSNSNKKISVIILILLTLEMIQITYIFNIQSNKIQIKLQNYFQTIIQLFMFVVQKLREKLLKNLLHGCVFRSKMKIFDLESDKDINYGNMGLNIKHQNQLK